MSLPTDAQLAAVQCAICQRPIERWRRDWNPCRDEWTYTVQCHGATDTITLGRSWRVSGWTVEGGVAFAAPQVTHEKVPEPQL